MSEWDAFEMIRLLKAACLAAVVALAGCATNQMNTAGLDAGKSSTVKTKSTKLAYGGNAERPVLFPRLEKPASRKVTAEADTERTVLFPPKLDENGKPVAKTLSSRTTLFAYSGPAPELKKAVAAEKSRKTARVVKKKKRVTTSAKTVRVVAKARKAKVPAKGGATHAAVTRYAKASGVPVALAHAVVRVESNYRASARGAAGEIGLMQVKLSTARMMGYRGSARGLYDPDTNLKYGMKYLAKAHQLGGGSVCGTILKYNAGHGAKRMNPISQRYCSKVKRYM